MIPFPDLNARPSLIGTTIEAFHGRSLLHTATGLLIGLTILLLVRKFSHRKHIKIVFTSPARNQVVPFGPYPVRLLFSAPIDRERSDLTLIKPYGEVKTLQIGLLSAQDVVSASLFIGYPGKYILRWRVSSVAGDHAAGSIRFKVDLPISPVP